MEITTPPDQSEKNQAKAFVWIVEILKKRDVPFQITGGLASRIYGSRRMLVDIDIEIPEDRFKDIVQDVQGYIAYGPAQYIDSHYDILLLTLHYQGQVIDISGAFDGRIFDITTNQWVQDPADFSRSMQAEIFGISVPVIAPELLIAYKQKLWRNVDRLDLREIQSK